jgi:nucleotide-binding universal stress UspA family protein
VPEEDLVYDGDELEPAYTPEQLAWHWRVEIGETEAELAHAADVIGQPGVEERIEAGNVAQTVCDVAREMRVDAIVIGCHTRSRLRRIFKRSVGARVVRGAPCPVVVVPVERTDSSASDHGSE